MTRYASPEQVDKAASDWTNDQLKCRKGKKHRWEPATAARVFINRTEWYWSSTETCTCGCLRYAETSMDGFEFYSYVKYPPGYLMPAGQGRVGPDGMCVIRVLNFERNFPVVRLSASESRAIRPRGTATRAAIGWEDTE